MARLARVEVFASDEIAVVRVISRTVRRCFLLGDDAVTGKNQDHRKQWIAACGSGRHLAPMNLKERSGETGPCVHKRGQRCSNKGFLQMSTADYLNLLDWTARQVRTGKRGTTPQNLAPLFDRLGVSSDIWCHRVKDFGKLFSIVAGQPTQIDGHRSKPNTHRYRARRAARELLSSV